jgi:hypothetical protein
MLIILMSICIFATVKPNVHRNNVSKESIRKPNVHKSNVSKEAIAKSKNKPMAISKEIQARRKNQLYPRKIKHDYIH